MSWDTGSVGAAEIIGADEQLLSMLVSGMGNTEIVGAAQAALSQGNVNLAQRIMARGAAAVVNRPLDSRRRFPLGFTPTSVAAGATATIPAAPQNLFRSERLVIPSDIAFDFGVADIKVGNQSQLAQSVEVPAALFSEVAIDTQVTFDTAEVGNQISVQVRNKTVGAITFTAAILGTVAK